MVTECNQDYTFIVFQQQSTVSVLAQLSLFAGSINLVFSYHSHRLFTYDIHLDLLLWTLFLGDGGVHINET